MRAFKEEHLTNRRNEVKTS